MNTEVQTITITTNGQDFTANLADTVVAQEFSQILPLNLQMADHLQNEKHAQLPENLTTNHSNPGHIEAGDIMLYGSQTIVVFYESFDTSFSYTRLATIEDPQGLAQAVGANSVSIEFSIKE